METYEIWITVLLVLSVVLLAGPILAYLICRFFVKPTWEAGRKNRVSWLFVFSCCLLGSVWCLRFAVNYFGIYCPELSTISADGSFEGLNTFEEIFNSLVHALQTFSMDEEYTEYIITGKTMVSSVFGADAGLQTVYGGYAAILNLLAPIIGGAFVLDIIASISPRIRLWISCIKVWKEKYYFSELNEGSLALAKSMAAAGGTSLKRPTMIFTDAYVDDEVEKSSERLAEAKDLGAICLKDDLSRVLKHKPGKKKFFLIDENENGNLQTLTALAGADNNRYIKNSEIYLFVNDDTYVQVEKAVCEKLRKDWGLEKEPKGEENGEKEEPQLPLTMIPVRSYRNLISNLLVDIPLYEPLIGKKRDKKHPCDLTVTILGTGHIGIEMFLATYWFGQILDCNLRIRVLSQESEEKFWDKIDYINPEIRHTALAGDPILRVNRQDEKAPVYCEVHYQQCDVRSSRFISWLQRRKDEDPDPDRVSDADRILDTDYYLVALGSDADNISVANTVRKYVGQNQVETAAEAGEGGIKRTVITYVVYDSDLAENLNREKSVSYTRNAYIYMRAVGTLKEVYSVRNVFLNEHERAVQEIHASYVSIHEQKNREKIHAERLRDDYKYWSNLARGMHKKYKMFSAGLITVSSLDFKETEGSSYKAKVLDKAIEKYSEYQFENMGRMSEEDREKMNRLAWLEHRRWNAFTRTMGYRGTKAYDAYVEQSGSYKEMNLKLHPCLLECDQKGIRVRRNEDGSLLHCEDRSDFDLLDDLSYDLSSKNYNSYDFKQYDYPDSDPA